MAGRTFFLLSFENVCVLFFLLSQWSDTPAPKRARGEAITHFPLDPALSGVTSGTLEAASRVVP